MKDEKETKSKLLASAKAEFLEKGYMNASLRSICKNAGVTTGALYFFFRDKEDLFDSLVVPTMTRLQEEMQWHFDSEKEEISHGIPDYSDSVDDIKATRQLVHAMYQNYDILLLAISGSKGSRYENCVDEFVTIAESHYRALADGMTEQLGLPRIDDYTIHWIAHMQIDVFVHLLQHEPSEEKAQQYIGRIVTYLVSGWMSLFDVDVSGKTRKKE